MKYYHGSQNPNIEKLNDPNSFWNLFFDNPTKSKADLNKTKDE